ncbi:response regulator [Planococcus sp. N064]|uniref:Transcriptional regulatory protein n=1 Tax=Planococcus liqunii TaxID=3058394 RepID=A0ABT8MST5_9BACL|nr:response regulator [Planococcus sp. N064]MDN7227977.1 response regulator [Planococcus sp. N064]
MNQEFHILIIEDDFRVADINRQLVEQVDGFQVAAIAKTGDEALDFLHRATRLPDLILLDMFIPDRSGLDLFWEIRSTHREVGIIMLTAAKDSEIIGETLRGGVSDYLIKPVDFTRFEQSLLRFQEHKLLLQAKKELEQSEIDQLLGLFPGSPAATSLEAELPKGIDHLTLKGVMERLDASAAAGVNAMDVGKAVGVSRSTARRYLEHLVSIGEAKAQLNYGEIGRPERRYIPWTK